MDDRPAPRWIGDWLSAESNAVEWMRYWGYGDAMITGGSADRGVDVLATGAVAQVKWQSQACGRPDLQRLVGANPRQGNVLLFFVASNYSKSAREYADERGIALFATEPYGTPMPMNSFAEHVAARVEQVRIEREQAEAERAAQEELARQERERAEQAGREQAAREQLERQRAEQAEQKQQARLARHRQKNEMRAARKQEKRDSRADQAEQKHQARLAPDRHTNEERAVGEQAVATAAHGREQEKGDRRGEQAEQKQQARLARDRHANEVRAGHEQEKRDRRARQHMRREWRREYAAREGVLAAWVRQIRVETPRVLARRHREPGDSRWRFLAFLARNWPLIVGVLLLIQVPLVLIANLASDQRGDSSVVGVVGACVVFLVPGVALVRVWVRGRL